MIVTSIPTWAPQADESPTDDELAHQALHNPEAFATLYHRYARRVYNYLYGKVGQAEAEDLTAQVFSELVESLHRYRPQGTFAAWLFTIARRRAANWFRNRRAWLPIEAAETQANTQADLLKQVIRNEETAFLRKCIQNLREDEIELLRLHFSAGLTYREMAGMLGKSESAVGVSMHRLLRRLEADCEAENG
jgi:RNA polymerase sigma-70 factor (ECF subfamily)